jgi:NADPH:quinone reductase-like Zn-dependent oxidoreductase
MQSNPEIRMQAAQRWRYGSPEVLEVGSRARPRPGPGEVLVGVRAALVSIGDVHVIAGKPYLVRLTPFGGIPRPRQAVPGLSLAGEVVAVGPGVEAFVVGDPVFGEGAGAFAEFAVARVKNLARKPAALSWNQAATVAWGLAPWLGLVELGRVAPGEEVLVLGASGGVGTWAVQIARSRGARVTAVCSGRNRELVLGLGAERVVDYTKQDPLGEPGRYDLVFDAIGDRSIGACTRVLRGKGRYVCCSGAGNVVFGPLGRMLAMAVQRPLRSAELHSVVALSPSRQQLETLAQLVETGQVKPVIERSYQLDQIAEALAHVATRRTRGQVVVEIQGS